MTPAPFGARVDELLAGAGLAVGLVFVVVLGVLVYAVARFGPERTPRAPAPGRRSALRVVLAAGAVFVVLDGGLAWRSTRDVGGSYWNFAAAEAQLDALRLEVNAHQWSWDVRAAGPDDLFGTPDDIVVLNEFHVPEDTPILLELTSTDVVHGFDVPAVRAKVDVVPGQVTRVWFRSGAPGRYEVRCAQFCGVQHYRMQGTLVVMPREAYATWAALASRNHQRGIDPRAPREWAWPWTGPKGAP